MKRLILEEELFYISYQDGRADNRNFDTREEAEAAMKASPDGGRGCYVTSFVTSRCLDSLD